MHKMILLILRVFKTQLLIFTIFFLELLDFKTRRVAAFKKNLIELTELEIKHAKVSVMLLFSCIQALQHIKNVFTLCLQSHAELLKKCLSVLREE